MCYLCTFSFHICRPIDNVLGFSRETIAAVICNIEGREWCHRSNQLGKPEHPRASTADDVECFFSMMRDAIGRNFTVQQVKLGFRKWPWSLLSEWILISHFTITPLPTQDTVKAHFQSS